MSEKTERAKAYFEASFNCAQSVFAPFAEDYDIECEDALRIAGGFGGGVRCGELCGAVSGGVMVVGASKGQSNPADTAAKQSCNAATIAFTDAFKSRHGALTCRELLGTDISTPEGQAKFADENLKVRCDGFVKSSVEILEEQDY